ncbi:RNA recognition motif-containing protein, putative isoform 4, partial [Theobroma cacao]
MAGNSGCSVYIGNLDERVSDRVLYDILIQAGRVVDLYIPRDKETDKPKGFAFAEYETEEVAEYAISGQDKASQNPPNAAMAASNSSHKSRHYSGALNHMEISQQPMRLSTPCRIPDNPSHYSQVPPLPGVSH